MEASEVCVLPADPGLCLAFFPKWFYDVHTNECQMFIYGGCQGNSNNFHSKFDCEKLCVAHNSAEVPNHSLI